MSKNISILIKLIIFITLGILLFFIGSFYSKIPLPNIISNININKDKILEIADNISRKYNIGPQKNYQQIAYFKADIIAQDYLNLKKNNSKINDNIYNSYSWHIRHYQENNIHESLILLTPGGNFYGFIDHIPEDLYLPSITEEQAKNKILEFINNLNYKITNYTIELIHTKNNNNNRKDYTFIYKYKINEIEYVINILICGNKITSFYHSINIPEEFINKFNKLKKDTEFTNFFANIIIYIIFIFIGSIISFLYLIKKKWLIIDKAITISIILALMELISKFNHYYLIWIDYNTASSKISYITHYILGNIFIFLISVIIYTIIISVAEGLTRLGLTKHIQFWKILNHSIKISNYLLKNIIKSYFIIIIYILLIIILYLFGKSIFKLYVPINILINTDILNTYIPSLDIIFKSIYLSFWQECIFRAIPLSFCKIITKNRGNLIKITTIIIGLAIESILFLGSYANFITFESYFLAIILIIKSIVLGIIYLKLGLYSSIISNYIYNIISSSFFIMLLPNNFKNILINKLIILIALFLPIIIILINKLIIKLKGYNPEKDLNIYNYNWITNIDNSKKYIDLETEPILNDIKKNIRYILYISGILCIFIIICIININPIIENININRNQAIIALNKFITEKNLENNIKKYKLFTKLEKNYYDLNANLDYLIEKYIWQKNKNLYNKLLEKQYINKPHWLIRLLNFSDIKSAEYNFFIDGKEDLLRYKLILPDKEKDISLNKKEAQDLAIEFVYKKYKLAKNDLNEYKAEEIIKPNRKDWLFIFDDNKNFNIIKESNLETENIKPQIYVLVSGKKIIDSYAYLNFPKKILKNEEKKVEYNKIIKFIINLLYFILIFIAFFKFFKLIKNKEISNKNIIILIIFIILYAIAIFTLEYLNFYNETANFTINKNYYSQIISYKFFSYIKIILEIIKNLVFFSLIINYNFKNQLLNKNNIKICLSLTSMIISIILLSEYFINQNYPTININKFLNSLYPEFLYTITNIIKYIDNVLYLLFIAIILNKKINIQSMLIFLIFIITIFPINIYYDFTLWALDILIKYLIFYFFYIFIIRYDITIILLIYTNLFIIKLIQNNFIINNTIITLINLTIIFLMYLIYLKILKNKSNNIQTKLLSY